MIFCFPFGSQFSHSYPLPISNGSCSSGNSIFSFISDLFLCSSRQFITDQVHILINKFDDTVMIVRIAVADTTGLDHLKLTQIYLDGFGYAFHRCGQRGLKSPFF